MNFINKAYSDISLELKFDHQLWITLCNESQSNAITDGMINSLTEILPLADFEPKIRVIVITGKGKNFCAGGDIVSMKEKKGMFAGDSNELRMRYMHGIQRIPKTIEEVSTPIIAMVNGAAVGAGCDLSMMCDLRIGNEDSKFSETFSKMGLVPGDGGTFFLTRVIGYGKAMQMFLTGEVYAGKNALEFGLLNYLSTSITLVKDTEELAKKISMNAPIALSMTKKAMKLAYLTDLSSSLDQLAGFQGIAQRTNDHFEAVDAFFNKRAPDFKGN
jgi:enoyl-CoA hydratase/carnithine racemase